MKYSLNPSPGMLVITTLPEEEMTESGLYLVKAQETASYIGEVVAIHPPPGDEADYFKVGDWVVIGKWAGTEVSIGRGRDTKKFLLVNEDSILATLVPEDGE